MAGWLIGWLDGTSNSRPALPLFREPQSLPIQFGISGGRAVRGGKVRILDFRWQVATYLCCR